MNNEKGFMKRVWSLQQRIEVREQRIGKGKYGRVLKMARKPTNDEFEKTSKITGLGILLIGGLGFIIFIIRDVVVPLIMKAFGH